MAPTRDILRFTRILFILAATVTAAHAGGQPISFFKEAPDMNGFIAVAADSLGIYAVSTAGVRRYDLQGKELWTQPFDSRVNGIRAAADNTGAYVLLPPATLPGPPQGPPPPCMLQRFTASGERSWSRNLDSC